MPQRNTLLFFEIVVCPFMADLSLFHFSTAALAGCDQENTTKEGEILYTELRPLPKNYWMTEGQTVS